MSDKAKAAICKAFGVTEDEVDALDRLMCGPESRAAQAQAERNVLAWAKYVADQLKVPCETNSEAFNDPVMRCGSCAPCRFNAALEAFNAGRSSRA